MLFSVFPEQIIRVLFSCLLFCGLVITQVTHAQDVNDILAASEYYQKGDSLFIARSFKVAIKNFKKASERYKKAEIWAKLASCYNRISENYRYDYANDYSFSFAKKALKISVSYLEENHLEKANSYDNIGKYYQLEKVDFDTALGYYEKALRIRKKASHEIARSYVNIGMIYKFKGDYEKGLNFLFKAVKISSNDIEVSNALRKIGGVFFKMDQYEKALHYYKESLEIRENHLEDGHMLIADSYKGIGGVYRKMNSNELALKCYGNVLNIFISNKLKGPRLAGVYVDIGIVQKKMGNLNKALEFYERALRIRKKYYGENHPVLVNSYFNMGYVYMRKKMFAEALKYFGKTLKINKNPLKSADAYFNIAKVYEKQRRYIAALEYHQKGLDVYVELLKPNDTNIINSLNEIGIVQLKMKQYEVALTYFNEAIQLNRELPLNRNVNHTHVSNKEMLLESFEYKAKALKTLYDKTKDLVYLKKSAATYVQSDVLIDLTRKDFQNHKDNVAFSVKAKELYAAAMQVQLMWYKNSNETTKLEKAFYYSEKSKATTLNHLLNNTKAKNFAGLSPEIVALEKELKTDYAYYQSRVIAWKTAKKNDSSKLIAYESKLFRTGRRQDSLTEILEKNYPKYHQLKYQNQMKSVSEIQEQLDSKTTVLEFFKTDSLTYVFSISQKTFGIQEIVTPNLDKDIDQLKQSILVQNIAEYKEVAWLLYQKLVVPVRGQLIGSQLIIIPDGVLWHLNFDLLLTQNSVSNDPVVWPYLLKEYAVSYANSANLLFSSFENKTLLPENTNKCLAFSYSDTINLINTRVMSLATLRESKEDLPGTRKEIRAISEIVDGAYFYGSEAGEANFKKNVGSYNILHLALHGEVDHKNPENSKLFFTKSKDTLEDNYLYAHELFAINVPAELAVLSACNTGSGKIAKGEGVMSLGNAFQYAGTKSLLLSGWEVSDQTTPLLMSFFYANLKKGMDKAKALQQAKLTYLQTANIRRTNPFYWGGFYLVGDTTPLRFEGINYWYWVMATSILILFGFGIRYVMKK